MERRDFLKRCSYLAGGVLASAATGVGADALSSAIPGKKAGSSMKPNILFLMTDQFRFDCLGCQGNPVIKTPNLDSLFHDGALFTHAYSCTPTCTPARSALLTGLGPWRNGMLGYGRVARHYKYELPRMIRAAGYYTMGIGKMHWFPQKTLHGFHATLVDESGRVESPGFISDYRRWFSIQAPGMNPDATGIGWNDYRTQAYKLPEYLHPTVWTGQTAEEFIKSYKKNQPFLLKVSFARPHSPYDPPQRFMEQYRTSDMPDPHIGDWCDRYKSHRNPPAPSLWHGDLGKEQVHRSRRGYYGSISFIDEQIGKILLALKIRGLYDNTLILFTADHGDMLGDHHLWRKSYAYEGSAHIPMLLRWPSGMETAVKRGCRITPPVEIRDILPTFLDAAQAVIPGDLDGMSLLKLLRDKNPPWREYIDLEHSICYSADNHWNGLTDGRMKYIFHAHDGREQLFDLQEDPGELKDLASLEPWRSTLLEWRKRMVRHLAERGEGFVKDGKLVAPRKNLLYSPNYPRG